MNLKLFLFTAAATAAMQMQAQTFNAPALSSTTLFDMGWRYTENDVPNGASDDCDTKEWCPVDLPHDWDIEHSPQKDAPMGNGGGYYPGGTGWYRKIFSTPKAARVSLDFDGVYQMAEVWINGKKAGTHAYGYTAFSIDITPYLKPKGDNVVAVRVDNSKQPNCRWYSGTGIYRHVWLSCTGSLHIAHNGVYVTTPSVTSSKADVSTMVTVQNESQKKRTVEVAMRLCGQNGQLLNIPAGTTTLTLEPGESREVTLAASIDNPKLWSVDAPHLYKATVVVNEGKKTLDRQTVRFGVRTISYSAEEGFKLNGHPLLINGACVHHDNGIIGAASFDDAEYRKVRLIKEGGFNLIRTSHNPPSRAFLEACDSLGMMVIDECYDGWYKEKSEYDYHLQLDSIYKEDFKAMVTRDRNHASIICWSIGNEVIERRDLAVVTTARNFKKAILQYDATRPVTEALCTWNKDWEIYDPHAEQLDIVGYNYMMHKHASDHARDPKRIMWQTESYPRDAFKNWKRTHDYPYIIGDIVWTGLDYLGESGIGRWHYDGESWGEHYEHNQFPYHGAYCGDIDLTGWRKPISHYRDMLWNGEKTPVVYLAVKEPSGYNGKGKIKETLWSVWPTWESWNWPGWEQKDIDVEIYCRAPRVRLYKNGQLVGEKATGMAEEYKAVFTTAYEPGTLKAVAIGADGKEMGEAHLATAGEPAKVVLTADRKEMTHGGQDIAYVNVAVVDSEGRVVPDAAVKLKVDVAGAARFYAAGSADFEDLEPFTTDEVTTWHGRACIVVRSIGDKGKAKVSVITETLPVASTTINVK